MVWCRGWGRGRGRGRFECPRGALRGAAARRVDGDVPEKRASAFAAAALRVFFLSSVF